MEMKDLNKDSLITSPADVTVFGNTDPRFYYSFSLFSVNWRCLQLDAFFDARNQPGASPLLSAYATLPPGRIDQHLFSNQTTDVLKAWQKPGDITSVQKLSSEAHTALLHPMRSTI